MKLTAGKSNNQGVTAPVETMNLSVKQIAKANANSQNTTLLPLLSALPLETKVVVKTVAASDVVMMESNEQQQHQEEPLSQDSSASDESGLRKKQKLLDLCSGLEKKIEMNSNSGGSFHVNGGGFNSAKKQVGTGIIVISCVYEDIEIGFLVLRSSAIRDFLLDKKRFGYNLAFFKRVDTFQVLQNHFGDAQKNGWAFLREIMENKYNPKYSFDSVNFVCSYSTYFKQNFDEYDIVKNKILKYISQKPLDANNSDKSCYLDARVRTVSRKELDVLEYLTGMFDVSRCCDDDV